MKTWADQLMDARRQLKLSRRELAALAGLSESSIQAYERGRRHPTRERLIRLERALQIDAAAARTILEGAGYAAEPVPPRDVEPPLTIADAARLIQSRPWPAFLVTRAIEVPALNDHARRILGMELTTEVAQATNMLTVITRLAVARRSQNWEALVNGMIGAFKAGTLTDESLEQPSSYFDQVLHEMCAGDPALVRRVHELWETVPAWILPMNGGSYTSDWEMPGVGVLHFVVLMTCVNPDSGLYIHDYIPGDAESHRLFKKVADAIS